MEIERKWLIRKESIPFRLDELPNFHVEQQYISFYPSIRIRNIDHGEQYILTVKTRPADGSDPVLSHNEYETPITREEYDNLKKLVDGKTIEKRRYLRKEDSGLTLEIDLFEGEFRGLAYLEIEFPNEEEARNFPDPPWVEREVTREKEYKNAALAQCGLPSDFEERRK